MTRASLLHVLDHLSEISDAEVRELEQLATAFPYCQTAHLLLAKAAHDRGSMLASQRLRRAATYATDRQLLRQLIESTAPVSAPTAPAEANAVLPTASEAILADVPTEPAVNDLGSTNPFDEPTTDVDAAFKVTLHETTDEPLTSAVDAPVEDQETAADTATVFEEDSTTPVEALAAPSEASVALLPETAGEELTTSVVLTDTEATGSLEAVPAEIASDAVESVEEASFTSQGIVSQKETSTESEQQESEDIAAEPELDSSSEELLPATAPPIRPPLEAGSSQFEFGLADSLPVVTPVYELVDAATSEGEAASQNVSATVSPFYGTDDIGYAFGAGSRMGYCLQSTDELTVALPTGSFEPDALILAHLAAYQATQPEAATRTSVDIISQFLRNKPRLKAPAAFVPRADEQTDLSVRSTRAEPDLASESLALIMVRQGKKDRAIEIYERLMMRQPEKMAYFADQIQKLKISE